MQKKSQSTPLSIIQVEDTNPDPPSENKCTTIVLTRIFDRVNSANPLTLKRNKEDQQFTLSQ